ncbi:MAG: hypothetical protein M3619_07510 [Myxococcota bacterium]|nr:hypothetical protein [Myxococcota bacterium]
MNGDAGIDSDDAPMEAGSENPTSCKAIKTAMPTSETGAYTIDPDGEGPDPPFTVICDMTTEGGGWTLVFVPSSSNLSSTSIAYTTATPRLLNEAVQVLLAYRTSMYAPMPNFAVFPMLQEWRVASPFSYGNMDVSVIAAVNGGSAATATLRFGTASFSGDRCEDPWNTNARWGRLCIVGTAAPLYTGYAVGNPDTCSDSQSLYNVRACEPEVRFTIAIR